MNRPRWRHMWNPWEWLKFFYENAGHKHPTVSAWGFLIVFAAVGWLVWWRLDTQYNKDHPGDSSVTRAATQIPEAPAPPDKPPPSTESVPKSKDLSPEVAKPKQAQAKKQDSPKPPPATQIIQNAPGGINSVITGGSPSVTNTVVNPRPTPRRIPPEKQVECSPILRQHRGIAKILAIQNGEAYQFAKDWYDLFKDAEWEVVDDLVGTVLVSGDPQDGIFLSFRGAPVAPNAPIEVAKDTPEAALQQCMGVLQMTPAHVRVQRYPDTPEGMINFIVLEQPQSP